MTQLNHQLSILKKKRSMFKIRTRNNLFSNWNWIYHFLYVSARHRTKID